jgi:hypothetical protein
MTPVAKIFWFNMVYPALSLGRCRGSAVFDPMSKVSSQGKVSGTSGFFTLNGTIIAVTGILG